MEKPRKCPVGVKPAKIPTKKFRKVLDSSFVEGEAAKLGNL